MVDALDNCDDPVIHIGNSNEAHMVDSDNVGDNRFTISIPFNFTSPSFDCRIFSLDSYLKKYVRDFLWLYCNAEDEGYKCRICGMFPPQSTAEDHPRAKFASEAVRSLTDHPKCY